jgi:transglutaminase-like putative cysteine protease
VNGRGRLGLAGAAAAAVRAAVYAFAAGVLWWPLSVPAGVAAAALAAAAGSLAADSIGAARGDGVRLRGSVRLALAALAAAAGAALARLLVTWGAAPELLGPAGAVQAAEVLRGAALSGPAAFALRWLSARRPALAALEVCAVGAALVGSVAAHREGMIHRPLALGDLAWSRGIDPTLVLLAVGVASAVLLAGLLVAEARRARIALHLGAVALLVLALVMLVRVTGLPQPRPPEQLGLTGEPEVATGKPRPQGSGGSQDQLEELRFLDEYGSDGGRAPVAVVVLHDDYDPPSGAYYFRQSVFSRYNGRRLVQATRSDVDPDVVARFPSQRLELPWAPPGGPARRPLLTTTGVLVDHVRPFALDSPTVLEPRAQEDARFRRVYETLSLVQTLPLEELLGRAPGDPDWSDEQRAYYTEAPEDPRYAALGEDALEVLDPSWRNDPLARAIAVKRYLDTAGTYSRKSSHADAEDPVASFLFGDLTGYCVHFSHAAVYLLRALGVPARVAAGYAVPAGDRAGGSAIMIRGLDAHAWPEIFLEGAGWVVVDLSPERVLDELAARPDPALQTMLGEMLRKSRGQAVPEPAGEAWPSLAQLARWLGIAALVAFLAGLPIKLFRRAAPGFATEAALPRVVYRAALDRFADVGVARGRGEGRERFATRAGRLAPSFQGLTRAHLADAWGGAPRAGAAELRAAGTSVSAELRRSVPGWRRAVGTLDPWSWLRSR